MSNEEHIRHLSQQARTSASQAENDRLARNRAIYNQSTIEHTPHTVIAEWSGLTSQHVGRIVRETKN